MYIDKRNGQPNVSQIIANLTVGNRFWLPVKTGRLSTVYFSKYGYCRYCKDRKNIKTSRNEARLFSRVAKCEIRLFKGYGIQLVCWKYNSKSRHTCNSCNDVWGEDRRFSRISEGLLNMN